MPTTTCVKCEHQLFEMCDQRPTGARYPIVVVQCAACGTPIGILEVADVGVQLRARKQEIELLASQLSAVESMVQQVLRVLQEKRHD